MGEKSSTLMPEPIEKVGGSELTFRVPTQEGAYRLFLFITDGHGNGAAANLHFSVRPQLQLQIRYEHKSHHPLGVRQSGPDYLRPAACRESSGPLVFNPDNAQTYGKWLGQRYRDAGLVWLLGGDKFIGDDEVAPWKATEFRPPVADQDWVLVVQTKP